MIKNIPILFLTFVCFCSTLCGQDVGAFSVSAEPVITFVVSDESVRISANGKTYLVIEELPTQVPTMMIVTEGDHQPWIAVRKIDGGRSVKLKPVVFEGKDTKTNTFFFEHQGPGEYEVTSSDKDREPVFDYFMVEGPEQPNDPDPVPSSGLIDVATKVLPADLDTARKLGAAWLTTINSLPQDATLDIAKQRIGKSRMDVLSLVRDQDGSWNKFLMEVDKWFKAQTVDVVQYRQHMTTLATWLSSR